MSAVVAVDLTRRRTVEEAVAAEAWGEPEPFDKVDVPAFPATALSPWLRAWAETEAVFTQTPLDLPGCIGLACASLAAARVYHVQVREGWTEPTNLWLAVALPPAERKSAVFAEATRPIYAYVAREAERLAPTIVDRALERSVLRGQVEAAQAQAVKGKMYEGRDALQVARELQRRLDDAPEVHAPSLLADDCTPEALALVLAANGERAGIFSAEGGPLELMAGRYSEKGKQNFELYLKAHPGDPHTVHRIKREALSLAHPLLTMALTVQPSVIAGLGANEDFRTRGLLGRFLYSLPTSALGNRAVDPPAIPAEATSAYERALAALLVMSGEQRLLRMSPAADRARAAFQQDLEPRLGPDGDLRSVTDWAGKLTGTVCRLAGVLHVADHALALEKKPEVIPVEAFERAADLGRYFLGHALAAFGSMGADETTEKARKLWKWVERRKLATFSEREAKRALDAEGAEEGAAVKLALGALCERNLVRQLPDAKSTGRPTVRYEVRP